MRQAGRSLPEYRALRERHSFFEIASTPELCAEVTLQPVRRHGVDAAVLFADIITPVLGHGDRRRAGRGRRAGGRARRSRPRPTSSGCSVPDTRASVLACARGGRGSSGESSSPSRRSSGSAAGRSPWRATSSREAEPRLRKSEGAHVPRAGGLARADGQADRHVRRVRAATGGAGRDAIQLFDSWVGALSVDRLRGVRGAVLEARARGRATCRRSTSAPARRTCSRAMARPAETCIGLDWRVPLDERLGRGGRGRAVQGNLDPAVLLGPWGRVEAAVGMSCARRRPPRATSSTSATACLPQPTRMSSAG